MSDDCNSVKGDITERLLPIHRDIGVITARVDGHDLEIRDLKSDVDKTLARIDKVNTEIMGSIQDVRTLIVQLAIFFVTSMAGLGGFVVLYGG